MFNCRNLNCNKKIFSMVQFCPYCGQVQAVIAPQSTFVSASSQLVKQKNKKKETFNRLKTSGSEVANKQNLTWSCGSQYWGQVEQGKCHGHGTMKWGPNSEYAGQIYTGSWKNNQRHGQGKQSYPDGSIYQGEFQDNEFSGQGVLNFGDGEKYQGSFKHGHPHGKGIWFYSNGDRYQGNFRVGKRDRWGIAYYKDGRQYVGEWQNNEMHGLGVFYNSSKEPVQEGLFQNGRFVEKKPLDPKKFAYKW